MDPESLYLLLAKLVAEMPELDITGPIPQETNQWLGRAAHLVELASGAHSFDLISMTSASNGLGGGLSARTAQTIAALAYRALAKAEANAPVAARGGVVAVGEGFTAIQVISKVFAEAKHQAMIIDAYLAGKAFTDFAPLAPEHVAIKFLSDSYNTKPAALSPFVSRWIAQFSTTRPMEVRLSQPRALHDRLIILDDGALVYSVSQSLQHFASRSPAMVHRVDADMADAKAYQYSQIWAASSPVT